MSWDQVRQAYSTLLDASDNHADMSDAWASFVDTISALGAPPIHVSSMIETLEEVAAETDPAKVRILDHGCGTAISLFYLIGLGYRDVWGVDIGGDRARQNSVLKAILKDDRDRLITYDGRTLPFEDQSFDFVFSQQVVEHLSDEYFTSYYAEEGRVLRAGGVAHHQVPHRLVPFESHTKTWLIHYLPKSMALPLYRTLGCNADFVRDHLHLRWPWRHFAVSENSIGRCTDLTGQRLSKKAEASTYDGNLRLRRLMEAMTRVPIVRGLVTLMLSGLVMIETKSRRN